MNNNRKKRPFGWSLWSHSARYRTVVGVRPMTVEEESESCCYYGGRVTLYGTKRVQHWGKKQNCRKCAKEDRMGDFTNSPTFRGVLVSLTVLVLLVVAIVHFA